MIRYNHVQTRGKPLTCFGLFQGGVQQSKIQ